MKAKNPSRHSGIPKGLREYALKHELRIRRTETSDGEVYQLIGSNGYPIGHTYATAQGMLAYLRHFVKAGGSSLDEGWKPRRNGKNAVENSLNENLYNIALYNSKGEYIGVQALIEGRTALSAIKKGVRTHNDLRKKYGGELAVRGRVIVKGTKPEKKLSNTTKENPAKTWKSKFSYPVGVGNRIWANSDSRKVQGLIRKIQRNDEVLHSELTKDQSRLVNEYPELFISGTNVVYLSPNVKPTKAGLKYKRSNPSERYNTTKLDELSAMFQGHISGDQIKTVGSDFTPNLVSRIGQLSLIRVKNGSKIYELSFDGDSWLGMDARKNLHINGKDTRIKNVSRPRKGELHLIGNLEQINYITAKDHIENGELVEYYHKLGEVDGIKPTLWLDHDSFLVINGGNYDIGVHGIEN